MAYQLREQTVSVVRKLRQDNPLKKFGLGAEDEARLVGHLLTVHEAPGSIPSTEETGDPRNPSTWNSSTSKVKSGGSGVPQLHSKFNTSVGHTRLCLQTNKQAKPKQEIKQQQKQINQR